MFAGHTEVIEAVSLAERLEVVVVEEEGVEEQRNILLQIIMKIIYKYLLESRKVNTPIDIAY